MHKFVFSIILALSVMASPAFAGQARIQSLITAAETEVTGSAVPPLATKKTYQAVGVVSASTGDATILIEASNIASEVDSDWLTLATITLNLTTVSVADGFAMDGPWKYIRARITDIDCDSPCEDPVISVYMGSEQ